jgi:hypothetical protein
MTRDVPISPFAFLRVLCGKRFWFSDDARCRRFRAITAIFWAHFSPTGVKAFKNTQRSVLFTDKAGKAQKPVATSQLLTVPFGCRPFRIEPLWIDPPTPLSVFLKRILSEQRLRCQEEKWGNNLVRLPIFNVRYQTEKNFSSGYNTPMPKYSQQHSE